MHLPVVNLATQSNPSCDHTHCTSDRSPSWRSRLLERSIVYERTKPVIPRIDHRIRGLQGAAGQAVQAIERTSSRDNKHVRPIIRKHLISRDRQHPESSVLRRYEAMPLAPVSLTPKRAAHDAWGGIQYTNNMHFESCKHRSEPDVSPRTEAVTTSSRNEEKGGGHHELENSRGLTFPSLESPLSSKYTPM